MDKNRIPRDSERADKPLLPPDAPSETPRRTRIFALLAALIMIALVLVYTYSLATGKIFAF